MSNTNTNTSQPGYVEQATNILSSAAETVSSYLPAALTGADSHKATKPTDLHGSHGVGGHPGAPGGVGDLGTDATMDVVRLPDERADSGPLQGAAGAAYAAGAAGFGVPSSADTTDTFAAPNTITSSNTTSKGYSGKGLSPGQFDGLEKVHPETSGTAAPLTGGSNSQYGSAEHTLAQAHDADGSKTSAPVAVTSSNTNTGHSGEGFQPGQFDGLDEIHSETSGTTAPLTGGSNSQYGSVEQTLAQAHDADGSKTSAPTQI